ncbi:MAG TPA: hypothetical protein VH025_01560 [Solirubrobacteraceae bacterium]|nr:hypothetical protein [Solirubrobacteraceae bacterium]
MPYATADARAQLLETIAGATEHLARALSDLSEAYEMLDDASAERMEDDLFGPVQRAYGRAQRTYAGFAERHDLPTRAFSQPLAGAPSHGAKGFIEGATAAVSQTDQELATLQDSMLPVEIGDAELRAGLEQVRELIGGFGTSARELTRRLGR